MSMWCDNVVMLTGDDVKIIYDIIDEKNNLRLFEKFKFYELFEVDSLLHKELYGTKWDVFVEYMTIKFCNESLILEFDTIHTPPLLFLEKLCNKFNVNVHIKYYEHTFAGEMIIENGNIINNKYTYFYGLYILDPPSFWDLDFTLDSASFEDFVDDYKLKLMEI